jgi:quercetin dioxygenase-like cupin family protein
MHLAWAARDTRHWAEDFGATLEGFTLALKPGETRFLRVEIAPGAQSPVHRTPQINDYLVALSGELVMILEDGSSVLFRPGDMLVQLAGWHSWRNDGDVPFVMASVLVGVETTDLVPYGVEFADDGAPG